MKKIIIINLLFFVSLCAAQMPAPQEIKMTSEYLSENQDISDLMFFKDIAFYKLKFTEPI